MNYLAQHLFLLASLTVLFFISWIGIQFFFLGRILQGSVKLWQAMLTWGYIGLCSLATSLCAILFLIGLIGWAIQN